MRLLPLCCICEFTIGIAAATCSIVTEESDFSAAEPPPADVILPGANSRSLLQYADTLLQDGSGPSDSARGEGSFGNSAASEKDEGSSRSSSSSDSKPRESVSKHDSSKEAVTGATGNTKEGAGHADDSAMKEWREAWDKTSILPAPLQLLIQFQATTAVSAVSVLAAREGSGGMLILGAIVLVVTGVCGAAFVYLDKSSHGPGILPGVPDVLRRNGRSAEAGAALMARANMSTEPRPGRNRSPRMPGSVGRQSSAEVDFDRRPPGPRGRPPALPPRQNSADQMGPRSSLRRDASTGSNGNSQVRFADGGGARSASPSPGNLLCRGLVVPTGSECVLVVPVLAHIGIPPAMSGVLPVRDTAGKAIVNLDVARPDGSQRPLCVLKPATSSADTLAYCALGADQGIVVYTSRREAFATLTKIGSSYALTSERMGIRLIFEGSFSQHALRVTNGQQLVADTQPTPVQFDTGHYYQLRATAQSDVGLLLCALVSIDIMES